MTVRLPFTSGTNLHTTQACDDGTRWAGFVHYARCDSSFTLCGLPSLSHTHGAYGVLCPDCDWALKSERVASELLAHGGQQ